MISEHGAERRRLAEDEARARNWKRWGPYLSERQWGTVREDYSPSGEAWNDLPHDHARSRAYRWGEDGLLGFSDRQCRVCFAIALWNGRDPILKERLFGLTNDEGNHGEDVKECYHYLDATPTNSYLKALYRLPLDEYPYARLVAENRRRGRDDDEFELEETGVFASARFADVVAEYARGEDPDDVLIRITVTNRSNAHARIALLPTVWFRNNWSWGCTHEGCKARPFLRRLDAGAIRLHHDELPELRFEVDGESELLFTQNNTNRERLYGVPNETPYVKDAFHRYVIGGESAAVDPSGKGTKAAALYWLDIPAGESAVVRARLRPLAAPGAAFDGGFEATFARCIVEADEFHESVVPATATPEERRVARQAYAGLVWSKQFYHYIVEDWLRGDADQPPPPRERLSGRNSDWGHLYSRDVISMPDKWEYPWFAAWDLAFHMVPYARIDPAFAKSQLELFLREWYMHPNGQIPAYEWAFGDVNPPVHAWAVWRVYKLTGKRGGRDRAFLERCFHKLLLNFTWWVNRKDPHGRNVFGGGFLGLDNIGVFDRSQPLPTGGRLEQADGTAWMAFFCGTMLAMAVELAQENPAYEDIASKFFEHFIMIADAINHIGGSGLWDEHDGFYYDVVSLAGERPFPLKVRSMVGLLPMIACEVLRERDLARMPGFSKRMRWFLENRRDLHRTIAYLEVGRDSGEERRLLAIPSRERLERLLRYLFDAGEFLSPHGIRSLSRYHDAHPYTLRTGGREWRVDYEPGESRTSLFGGNSNWRGPVWFPVNHLLVEALERYDYFYGDSLLVEYPVGSGRQVRLREAARDVSRRLVSLFLPNAAGERPFRGGVGVPDDGHLLFHEFFHGETGRGLGASHQTGWTALVTRCIEGCGAPVSDPVRARG